MIPRPVNTHRVDVNAHSVGVNAHRVGVNTQSLEAVGSSVSSLPKPYSRTWLEVWVRQAGLQCLCL